MAKRRRFTPEFKETEVVIEALSGSLGKIVWYTSSLHPIEIVKNK